MKKKKKKKKVLDLDALEDSNAPSNVEDKSENVPDVDNKDNEVTEEKEEKGKRYWLSFMLTWSYSKYQW